MFLLHTQLSAFTLYILICLEGSLSSYYCPSINGRLLLVTEEFGFWPKSVGVIFQVQPWPCTKALWGKLSSPQETWCTANASHFLKEVTVKDQAPWSAASYTSQHSYPKGHHWEFSLSGPFGKSLSQAPLWRPLYWGGKKSLKRHLFSTDSERSTFPFLAPLPCPHTAHRSTQLQALLVQGSIHNKVLSIFMLIHFFSRWAIRGKEMEEGGIGAFSSLTSCL